MGAARTALDKLDKLIEARIAKDVERLRAQYQQELKDSTDSTPSISATGGEGRSSKPQSPSNDIDPVAPGSRQEPSKTQTVVHADPSYPRHLDGYNLTHLEGFGNAIYIGGMSLTMIAEAVEMSVSQISRIFNGDRNPPLRTRRLIAGKLGMTVEGLDAEIRQRVKSNEERLKQLKEIEAGRREKANPKKNHWEYSRW